MSIYSDISRKLKVLARHNTRPIQDTIQDTIMVELRVPLCKYKKMISNLYTMIGSHSTDEDKLRYLNHKFTLDDMQKGGVLIAKDGEWTNESIKKGLFTLFNTSMLKEAIPFSETFYICLMEHHDRLLKAKLKAKNIDMDTLDTAVNLCEEDVNDVARVFENTDFMGRLRCIEQMNEYYSNIMVLDIVPYSLGKSNAEIINSFRSLFHALNLSEADMPYSLSDKYSNVRERLSSLSAMKRKRIDMCQNMTDILVIGHTKNLVYNMLELVEPYFQNFSMKPLSICSKLQGCRMEREIFWHRDESDRYSMNFDHGKLTHVVKDNILTIMNNTKR